MNDDLLLKVLAIIISLFALGASIFALYFSNRSYELNIKIFQRQGVINLFSAWQGVNELNPDQLIGPDIIKAANALALTSTIWNHDIIDKVILYQTYWEPFKQIYDILNITDKLVPGLNKTCKSLISSDIKKAYKDMEKLEVSSVLTSKLNGGN